MHEYSPLQLAPAERPRERLIEKGPSALSTAELIAVILTTGTKGIPVTSLSHQLLATYGTVENLADSSIERLRTIKGMGLTKAAKLSACFELARRISPLNPNNESITSPEDAVSVVRKKLPNIRQEHLFVIALNARHMVIATEIVFVGTVNMTITHPREIFHIAMRHCASTIILAHNHPSGDTHPSDADIQLTKRMVDAGKIMDIPVVDHIIFSPLRYTSLKQEGHV